MDAQVEETFAPPPVVNSEVLQVLESVVTIVTQKVAIRVRIACSGSSLGVWADKTHTPFTVTGRSEPVQSSR